MTISRKTYRVGGWFRLLREPFQELRWASVAPMTPGTKVVAVGALVIIIGLGGGFMWLVTTFLFHFSGGQVKMGPVVDYGALVVIGLTILVAVAAWIFRSPVAAVKVAAITAAVAWVVAVFVEWLFSKYVFITGAP